MQLPKTFVQNPCIINQKVVTINEWAELIHAWTWTAQPLNKALCGATGSVNDSTEAVALCGATGLVRDLTEIMDNNKIKFDETLRIDPQEKVEDIKTDCLKLQNTEKSQTIKGLNNDLEVLIDVQN
ncbi:hypothetical protein EYF80_067467 [Liparis tanakae]|uniref:Uncharacterized protein n=1 Tax=Liparis tanakae TaxID=230148 RepID=A0A4Z2E116_9TELE|nr:hypothetical protein EYF80_067467 [Liparis tanakae]